MLWTANAIFSVTRRYRSDVCDSLTELLTVSTDFTDVTLVSEDIYGDEYNDDKDDDEKDDKDDEVDEVDEDDEDLLPQQDDRHSARGKTPQG